jgi:hypothetical protein
VIILFKQRFKAVVSSVSRFVKKKALALGVSVGVVTVASNFVTQTAHATFLTDIGLVTVDTAPVFAIGLIVITGLAAIWAIKKTISLIRSR